MSVIHMDTDQVLSVQKALAQAGNEISNEIHLLSNSISNIPWQGASHDEFIIDFETLSRSLLDRGDSLLNLASRIEREIARWMDMDSKFGTGAAIGIGVGAPAVMTMALNAGESPQEPVYSTMMVGEEGQKPPEDQIISTDAVGEEGQSPDLFTRPLNEEGQSVSMLSAEEGQAPGDGGRYTSFEVGEEGQTPGDIDRVTTMAIGEEGQAPGEVGRFTTLAVGEEGQVPGSPEIGKIVKDPPIITAELGEEGLKGKLPSMPDFTHDFGEEGYNARLQWE